MNTTISYTRFDSPLGPMLATAEGGALTGLYFVDQRHFPEQGDDWLEAADAAPFPALRAQLADYFDGTRREFELPLAPGGGRATAFQQDVWKAIAQVPLGSTATYGALATACRRASAVRAAGAATGRNPICVIIPCHRIVGSDGSLTGYAGGLERTDDARVRACDCARKALAAARHRILQVGRACRHNDCAHIDREDADAVMTRRDIADLLLLAMLWGGSFLLMRIAAPEFGAIPMAETRVVVAALFLLVLLRREGRVREMMANWRGIAFVGIVNSAIPFTLFGYAMLSITAGVGSILNATSPLFGALIAFLWLGDRLPVPRVIGLVVGLAGVAVLVGGKPSFEAGGEGWAIALALAGSLSYGIGPNFTKLRLTGVSALAIATGSQIAAALVLIPFAVAAWPTQVPSAGAWGAVVALGIACTGLAYILYFRLIANIGPTRAIAVTFLIPAFGMLWGAIFLSEPVTAKTIAGGAVILFGTALATGLIGAGAKTKAADTS